MRFSNRVNQMLGRLATVVGIAVMLCATAAFFSGRIGYVVTRGVSMQPTYHAGDVVLTAATGHYRAGDIIEYRGGQDGRMHLLHRIVGGDTNGFVVKGDNNQSTDPTHPRATQILGRAIIHIPRLGAIIESPITRLAALSAIATFAGYLLITPKRRPEPATGRRPTRGPSTHVWKMLAPIDVMLVVAVAASFAVATRPARATTPAYRQTNMLTYHSNVRPSATYPTGRIVTGDPVFVKLLHLIGVSFHSTTNTPGAAVRGSVRLDAAFSTASGWHTSMPLARSTPLEAGTADVSANLDLMRIQRLATRVAAATGVATNAISIAITASTIVTLGSAPPLNSTSTLPLQLTPLELTMPTNKLSPSPLGPALVSTVNLSSTTSTANHPGPAVEKLRLGLLALLLLAVAATLLVWPEGRDDEEGARAIHSEPTQSSSQRNALVAR